MAQNENVLWDVLRLLHGKKAGWTSSPKGKEPVTTSYDHACDIIQLKGELVLKYRPVDIEDTIYFMWNRDYLAKHSPGMAFEELVYSLSEKALDVIERQELPDNEQKAFEQALWEIKPRLWGMGPNFPEMWKRVRRRLSRKN